MPPKRFSALLGRDIDLHGIVRRVQHQSGSPFLCVSSALRIAGGDDSAIAATRNNFANASEAVGTVMNRSFCRRVHPRRSELDAAFAVDLQVNPVNIPLTTRVCYLSVFLPGWTSRLRVG